MEVSESMLDPASSKFDAKSAIYSGAVDTRGAEAFNTVEQCITAIQNKEAGIECKKEKQKKKKDEDQELEPLQRNFLPEQMPVPVTRKQFKHVLIRMEAFTAGPLATLGKWKEEKIKVKVWTRGIDKIRGFATGFIVAFDKHWNLALTDVDEQFNRHRSRKTYLTSGKSVKKLLPSDLPVEIRVGSSVMRVVRIQGKYEVCVRHVPQVLLRGEHVAMVAKLM